MAEVFVGVDLGGTNIKVGCFDSQINLIEKTSVPTGAEMGPESVVERIVQAGACDPAAIETVGDELLVGEAAVLGAVSFYEFLHPENARKKVLVCNGTACPAAI